MQHQGAFTKIAFYHIMHRIIHGCWSTIIINAMSKYKLLPRTLIFWSSPQGFCANIKSPTSPLQTAEKNALYSEALWKQWKILSLREDSREWYKNWNKIYVYTHIQRSSSIYSLTSYHHEAVWHSDCHQCNLQQFLTEKHLLWSCHHPSTTRRRKPFRCDCYITKCSYYSNPAQTVRSIYTKHKYFAIGEQQPHCH